MAKMISLVADLKQIIKKSKTDIELSLPMIVVIGSQSTGKSSLLQSIIGKQFLPKGKGIVTRRPIQIQLCHIQSDRQFGELIENKGYFYEDLYEFRKAIHLQIQKVCGNAKGVSPIPLRIKYYSKNVLDIFLVDLPGFVQNSIEASDAHEQTRKMIKYYTRNPNCIILAVSKATGDQSSLQSLKMAIQIDRQGSRTIGVITQVDLMNPQAKIIDDYATLSNKLQLGHTCVYLRPSNSNLSLVEQLKKQKQFFQSHPQYHTNSDKLGVAYLKKIINQFFTKKIKVDLIKVRESIVSMYQSKKAKLRIYGANQKMQDKKAQGILILSLVHKYAKNFRELIEGKSVDSREFLIGGARIEHIFSQIFMKSINNMNPFEYLTDTQIRTAIRNANGLSKSLFLPQLAFQTLIRTQISRFTMPSLECAQLIYQQLRRIIHEICLPEIQKYSSLCNRISEIMEDLLNECLTKTKKMIRNLIDIQLGYINTKHPDFIDFMSLVGEQKEDGNEDMSIDVSEIQADNVQEGQQSFIRFKKIKNSFQKDVIDQSQIMDCKLTKMKNHQFSKGIYQHQQITTKQNNIYSSSQINDPFPRYKLPSVPPVINLSHKPNMREQTQTKMIKKLMKSYFNIVKKNINDCVPKTIITMLVQFCKIQCEKVLISDLYVQSEFDFLLAEKQETTQFRKQLERDTQQLKICLNSINKIQSQL